ncbi:AdoMet-dependent rRNA methyltransferase SPB1 [Cryptococcus sp. DSM 104549]
MGKHDKKTGKGRLDKYYRLAKEQGYRARSAFKLVHLNRKYDLLSKSKCVIDLCAAPGGWLQVAEKYMPKGSLIIGVDLNAIKPLPHVTTFVSDITTPHCRQQLRMHMHDWKADLVLHDGAPNVGSAWVQDAFTQNELVLQSLKLATEFLIKGGSFVTKVFRSQDYNSLMWVFGQLFKSVEATKPPSSRNVSAEIFVVCRDFIAPKHIDPKFLDPKHVFKDFSSLPTSITAPPPTAATTTSAPGTSATQASTTSAAAAAARLAANSHAHSNVFAPEKKRRHREGYAEGDHTLFHSAEAEEFVKGMDPVLLLGNNNKIEFRSDEAKAWLKSRHTTPDIIANFQDLKVLGKGDFKALMKWRLAIRLEIGLDVKADATADATEEVAVEELDEEEQITEELKRLQTAKAVKANRERKRANEKKARDLLKLQLHMTVPDDLDQNDLALQGEEEIFDLEEGEGEARRQGKAGGLKSLHDIVRDADGMESSDDAASSSEDESDDEVLDSDEERERKTAMLEGELDGLYENYMERKQERDAKWKVKNDRAKDRNFDAWHGIQDKGSDEEGAGPGADGEESEEEVEGGWDVLAAQKAKIGENDSDSDSDSDADTPKAKPARQSVKFEGKVSMAGGRAPGGGLVTSLAEKEQRAQMSRQAQVWFDQPMFKEVGDLAALDGDDESEEDEEEEEEDEEMEESEEESEEDEDEDVDMDDASSTLEGDDFEIVPQEPEDDGTGWDVDDEDQDEVKRQLVKDKGLLTAEAVSLATALVNRQITSSQLVDQGFNRLSTFHKDGLPSWFLDDESKNYKPNIPITADAVAALKARQRALDARPIKKVAEAKARKKFKTVQRMEKAKKKADGVMESEEMGDGEKARQVRRMLAKAARGKEKAKDKKVVVAMGANKGIKGRPKGVKGKYKIVDARMRKEVRALKRVKKANKKR